MESFWQHPVAQMTGYYTVVLLCLLIAMAMFEVVTKYKNWEEIQNGNVAVALATGGKIVGICNVFRYSIEHHSSLLETIGWGMFGFVLLIIAYLLFEFVTPKLNVDEEIANDNRAVGLISCTISVGLSFVIGSTIP